MILEKYFQKKEELKTANTWKRALETREVERNSFRASGDVKKAREFALAVREQIERPTLQTEITEESHIVPTVVFARA